MKKKTLIVYFLLLNESLTSKGPHFKFVEIFIHFMKENMFRGGGMFGTRTLYQTLTSFKIWAAQKNFDYNFWPWQVLCGRYCKLSGTSTWDVDFDDIHPRKGRGKSQLGGCPLLSYSQGILLALLLNVVR